MSQPIRCPECGAELPSGALGGLCPKCLLAAGLESRDEPGLAGSGSQAPTTPHSTSFTPPDAEWLAAHFPQLEILELLGHGGMGAVYKARQPKLDRLVALKIIRPESADDPAFAERFNREARMLARLSHPHIVAVYDFGSVDISLREMNPHAEREDYTRRPLYYFLMEYVDGTNLRQLLQAGELLPQQALAIVPQICEALQFAHDEGIVHRDIKPENILLDKRGRVKIADFGLAKLAAGSPQEFTLTGTHQVMGTPRYMAPEQMEGSHAVDHRADIYSLGVVFYEMLTGEVPMGHFEPPSKKVEVDVRLDEVVLRSLAREPQRRYQHASDVKTDVESISETPPPARMPVPSLPTPADNADIEVVREQVRLPAIFLAVIGLLSATVLLFILLQAIVAVGLPMLQRSRTGHGEPASLEFAAPLLAIFAIRLGISLIAVIGAVKMLRLTSYKWAVAASVASLFPTYFWPLWLLGVAFGIWSLVLLNKADVKRGFTLRSARAAGEKADQTSAGETDGVRERVLTPAIFLLVMGIATFFGWLVMMPGLLYGFWQAHADLAETYGMDGNVGMNGRVIVTLIAVGLLAIPLTMIIGAVKMMRLNSYRWSVAASVAALSPVPAFLFWPITLPLGIWSLYVLTRPEVKAGFVSRKQRLTDVSSEGIGLLAPRERTALAPGMGPRLLLIGGAMVFGALVIAGGVVSLVIGLVKESPSSHAFWGWMGSAAGCILGGAGALVGTWNNYRQLGGRADLFAEPNRTWLDDAIHGLTLIGILTVAAAMVLSNWVSWYPACYFLVLMGGIVTFQGVLFMVIRAVMRHAARQEIAGQASSSTVNRVSAVPQGPASFGQHGISKRLPKWIYILGMFQFLLGLFMLTGVGIDLTFADVEPLDEWLASNRALREWGTIQTSIEPWIGGVIACLLLASGIGLLLGRGWGRTLALTYATMQIAWGIFSWPLYAASVFSLYREAAAPNNSEEGTMIVGATVALVALCVLDIIYPLLVLIVLNRPRIRHAFAKRGVAGAGNVLPAASDSDVTRIVQNPAWGLMAVATLMAVAMGIGVSELPQRLDQRAANKQLPPSEQNDEPNAAPRVLKQDDWDNSEAFSKLGFHELMSAPLTQNWIMTSDGPVLTDGFVRVGLELDATQIDEVKRVLQAVYADYLKIEQRHLEQQTADDGHLIITIKPHPEAVTKLEDRLWTALDAVLDPTQQRIARLNLQLDPPPVGTGRSVEDLVEPGFFGWGKEGATIEIWQVGTWYRWKVRSSGLEYNTDENNLGGRELPGWLRRYWKESDGQATSPTSDG
jgi:serine/threonine protein kinase